MLWFQFVLVIFFVCLSIISNKSLNLLYKKIKYQRTAMAYIKFSFEGIIF